MYILTAVMAYLASDIPSSLVTNTARDEEAVGSDNNYATVTYWLYVGPNCIDEDSSQSSTIAVPVYESVCVPVTNIGSVVIDYSASDSSIFCDAVMYSGSNCRGWKWPACVLGKGMENICFNREFASVEIMCDYDVY